MNGDLIDMVDKTLVFGNQKRYLDKVEGEELHIIKSLLSWKKRRKCVHIPTVHDKSKLVTKSLSSHESFRTTSSISLLKLTNYDVVAKVPVPNQSVTLDIEQSS